MRVCLPCVVCVGSRPGIPLLTRSLFPPLRRVSLSRLQLNPKLDQLRQPVIAMPDVRKWRVWLWRLAALSMSHQRLVALAMGHQCGGKRGWLP